MKQIAEVEKNEKGEWVARIDRPTACAKCGACGGGKAFHMKLENGKPGTCQIEMPTGHLFLAATIAYGIPLLFFVLGLAFGYPLASMFALPGIPDLWAALFGFILMIMVYLIIKAMQPWMNKRGFFTPRITMLTGHVKDN